MIQGKRNIMKNSKKNFLERSWGKNFFLPIAVKQFVWNMNFLSMVTEHKNTYYIIHDTPYARFLWYAIKS